MAGFEEVCRIGTEKSASVYPWSSGDCRFGLSDGQTDTPEFLQHFRKSLNRDPMQLNVLPHRDIGDAARMAASEIGDGTQLVGSQ